MQIWPEFTNAAKGSSNHGKVVFRFKFENVLRVLPSESCLPLESSH